VCVCVCVCRDASVRVVGMQCAAVSKVTVTNGKEENGLQQKDKTNQICSELVQTTGHEMDPREGGGGCARGNIGPLICYW